MTKSRNEIILLYEDTLKLLFNYDRKGFEKFGTIFNHYKYATNGSSPEYDYQMLSELIRFLNALKNKILNLEKIEGRVLSNDLENDLQTINSIVERANHE